MQGIQYVMNEKGRKIAVQIDLKIYGDLWEDFYDVLTARTRVREQRETFEYVKARLSRIKKI